MENQQEDYLRSTNCNDMVNPILSLEQQKLAKIVHQDGTTSTGVLVRNNILITVLNTQLMNSKNHEAIIIIDSHCNKYSILEVKSFAQIHDQKELLLIRVQPIETQQSQDHYSNHFVPFESNLEYIESVVMTYGFSQNNNEISQQWEAENSTKEQSQLKQNVDKYNISTIYKRDKQNEVQEAICKVLDVEIKSHQYGTIYLEYDQSNSMVPQEGWTLMIKRKHSNENRIIGFVYSTNIYTKQLQGILINQHQLSDLLSCFNTQFALSSVPIKQTNPKSAADQIIAIARLNHKLIATCNEKGLLKLWSIEERKVCWEVQLKQICNYLVGFKGELYCCLEDSVQVWNIEKYKIASQHSLSVKLVALVLDEMESKDNTQTAMICAEQTGRLFAIFQQQQSSQYQKRVIREGEKINQMLRGKQHKIIILLESDDICVLDWTSSNIHMMITHKQNMKVYTICSGQDESIIIGRVRDQILEKENTTESDKQRQSEIEVINKYNESIYLLEISCGVIQIENIMEGKYPELGVYVILTDIGVDVIDLNKLYQQDNQKEAEELLRQESQKDSANQIQLLQIKKVNSFLQANDQAHNLNKDNNDPNKNNNISNKNNTNSNSNNNQINNNNINNIHQKDNQIPLQDNNHKSSTAVVERRYTFQNEANHFPQHNQKKRMSLQSEFFEHNYYSNQSTDHHNFSKNIDYTKIARKYCCIVDENHFATIGNDDTELILWLVETEKYINERSNARDCEQDKSHHLGDQLKLQIQLNNYDSNESRISSDNNSSSNQEHNQQNQYDDLQQQLMMSREQISGLEEKVMKLSEQLNQNLILLSQQSDTIQEDQSKIQYLSQTLQQTNLSLESTLHTLGQTQESFIKAQESLQSNQESLKKAEELLSILQNDSKNISSRNNEEGFQEKEKLLILKEEENESLLREVDELKNRLMQLSFDEQSERIQADKLRNQIRALQLSEIKLRKELEITELGKQGKNSPGIAQMSIERELLLGQVKDLTKIANSLEEENEKLSEECPILKEKCRLQFLQIQVLSSKCEQNSLLLLNKSNELNEIQQLWHVLKDGYTEMQQLQVQKHQLEAQKLLQSQQCIYKQYMNTLQENQQLIHTIQDITKSHHSYPNYTATDHNNNNNYYNRSTKGQFLSKQQSYDGYHQFLLQSSTTLDQEQDEQEQELYLQQLQAQQDLQMQQLSAQMYQQQSPSQYSKQQALQQQQQQQSQQQQQQQQQSPQYQKMQQNQQYYNNSINEIQKEIRSAQAQILQLKNEISCNNNLNIQPNIIQQYQISTDGNQQWLSQGLKQSINASDTSRIPNLHIYNSFGNSELPRDISPQNHLLQLSSRLSTSYQDKREIKNRDQLTNSSNLSDMESSPLKSSRDTNSQRASHLKQTPKLMMTKINPTLEGSQNSLDKAQYTSFSQETNGTSSFTINNTQEVANVSHNQINKNTN